MSKNSNKARISTFILLSVVMLITFAVYTLCVAVVDVQPIGPNKGPSATLVGFAEINGNFRDAIGHNFTFKKISDILEENLKYCKNTDYLIIESNHDISMELKTNRPQLLKERVLKR